MDYMQVTGFTCAQGGECTGCNKLGVILGYVYHSNAGVNYDKRSRVSILFIQIALQMHYNGQETMLSTGETKMKKTLSLSLRTNKLDS